MASYCLLKRGDRLPSVGVLQTFINRSGAELQVDGHFGRETHEALVEFQKKRSLSRSGVADKATWDRLLHREMLPLIEMNDVFDADALDTSGGESADESKAFLGGLSKGVERMAQQLTGAQRVFLVRVMGERCLNVRSVAMIGGGWRESRGRYKVAHTFSLAEGITSQGDDAVEPLPAALLRRAFGPFGSLELHGCQVAANALAYSSLRKLADYIGVPVTAGVAVQRSPRSFDGPTFTAVPCDRSLAAWCEGLPTLTQVKIP